MSIELASLRNLTAEPEVNYSPKGTAVVSASIANNESYGCAGSGVGRISYASLEFTGKHYGYHDRDHYDRDRYYHEGQSEGNKYRSDRPRRSTCICEQMPVSELAVMDRAAVNFEAQGERERTHGGDHWQRLVSSLNCVKQVLRCAGILRTSRCVRSFSPADYYPSAG